MVNTGVQVMIVSRRTAEQDFTKMGQPGEKKTIVRAVVHDGVNPPGEEFELTMLTVVADRLEDGESYTIVLAKEMESHIISKAEITVECVKVENGVAAISVYKKKTLERGEPMHLMAGDTIDVSYSTELSKEE